MFRCGCSKDRVLTALGMLGAGEVGRLLHEAEEGRSTVLTCEFCRSGFEVSVDELRGILDQIVVDRRDGWGEER